MEINMTDMLLLFVLAVILAIIIGINVIFVVDKRLSDIKINVPSCPAPNFYINTNTGSIRKVELQDTPLVLDNRKNTNTGVEKFNNITKSNENNNEHSSHVNESILPLVVTNDVYDKNKTHNHHTNVTLIRDGYHKTSSDKPNTGELILYPDDSDTFIYKTNALNMVDNRKIQSNMHNIPSEVKGQLYKSNTIKTKIMTGNGIVDQNITLTMPKLYMGAVGPNMRGFDSGGLSIERPADIDQIGSIPVNDYYGEPLPSNSLWW
jgi:hypothetical protein